MGTEPLEPGLCRSHGELLGTTLLLLAIILLKSVFMLGEKKKAANAWNVPWWR